MNSNDKNPASLKTKKGFLRRDILKLISFAGLSTLFPSRVSAKDDFRNDKNVPKQYIQNRDVPGFHIRSANPFLGVDMGNWGLAVGGMVKNPIGLGYEDLFGLKMVQPDPAAKFVYIQSADSYYESFALEELLRPRVLFVLRMNGKSLSKDHGYPLRLIAPFKYGYKNIKYITSIKFLDTRKRNYWSNSGPYSVDGTIQPGIDHPLDFNKKPLPINGGEVFHFFDKRPPV